MMLVVWRDANGAINGGEIPQREPGRHLAYNSGSASVEQREHMVLNDEQVNRFFDTMDSLLYYVNERFHVVKDLSLESG